MFNPECVRNNFKSPLGQSCKDLGHQRFVNKLSTKTVDLIGKLIQAENVVCLKCLYID